MYTNRIRTYNESHAAEIRMDFGDSYISGLILVYSKSAKETVIIYWLEMYKMSTC